MRSSATCYRAHGGSRVPSADSKLSRRADDRVDGKFALGLGAHADGRSDVPSSTSRHDMIITVRDTLPGRASSFRIRLPPFARMRR